MSAIKVVVRPRPVDEGRKEKWAAGFEIHGRRITLGAKTYETDVCLSHTASQEEVFAHAVPILDAVKDGNNGTILVYGQTGTGKTHTMIGGTDGYDGITMSAIAYLLEHVRERTMAGHQMALSMSVLEIYNERVTDMLVSDDVEVALVNGFPRNTSSATISSMEDAIQTVRQALNSRHVSATAMNDRSSRSHVIFMLDLAEVTEDRTEVAHLFLVDLAGSESIKKSQAAGKAAQEAGMINKSLLALKNVILTLSAAASENSATRPHVPYRDSRLTELLQDSIGGSARTMFIACISPNGRDVDETKSTLEYATKAKSIKNMSSTERDKLNIKIRGLEVELQKCKNSLQDRMSERGGYFVTKAEHDEMQSVVERLAQSEADVRALLEDKASYVARHNVTASQIGIYRDMVKSKDAEVRRARDIIECMAKQFQATVQVSESACATAVAQTQGAVAAMCNLTSQRLSEASTCLDARTLLEQNDAVIEKMWESLNARATAAVRKVCEAHFKLCDQMRMAQVLQAQKIRDAVARSMATLTSELNGIEAVVDSASSDMNMDLLSSRAAVEPLNRPVDVSDRVGVRHVVENVVEQCRKVLLDIEPPQMSDDITRGFSAVRNRLQSSISTASREALSHLSNIDAPPPPTAPPSPCSPAQRSARAPSGSTAPELPLSPTRTRLGTYGRGPLSTGLPPRPGTLSVRSTPNEPINAAKRRTRSMSSDATLDGLRRKASQPTASPSQAPQP